MIGVYFIYNGLNPNYSNNIIPFKPTYNGKVTLKVLVDKEGKSKRAVVILSDSEILNQNAIIAAMNSVFTPALQNNHPIAVWVCLTYRFTLENK